MTAGVAAAVTPRRHEHTIGQARLAEIVPQRVGPWRPQLGGHMILPESDQPDNFYDQVLTRTFSAPNQPAVMLLIAYGAAQSGLMKVHRPEVCYASAGFSISDDQPTAVRLHAKRSISAKVFIARREDRVEQVLYWTRISDQFPRDLTGQRLVVLERGLRGVIPDGVLVRVSTLGGDERDGVAAMNRFAQALVASADPRGRALLIGSVS